MRSGLTLMHGALPLTADGPSVMDEEAFRAFYDRTARRVWAVLYRTTRDAALADDLLQEAFYRLLRARRQFETEAHREHYLFRIAVNLAADERRRRVLPTVALDAQDDAGARAPAVDDGSRTFEQRADVDRALATLAPRDRDLLWLAYADGESHREIASRLGVGTASIKVMLFRARQRLASRLRGARLALQGRTRR